MREGRVVFDGSPERLTDESLSRIYAGDPYGTAASSVDSQDDVHFRREDPVRLMEDRDGVSSH